MKRRLTNWEAKDSEKSRQKALELCENARGQLVLHYPFVGHLGLQIDFIPVVDSRIRTIATNGKVIYIRPEWICQLPMVTRAAIIAHTIWTAALCHSFRRGELDARRFDAASDLEVYSLLKAEKVAMAIKPDYADQFPQHKTVEEIFKALPKKTAARSEDADVHLYMAGRVNLPTLPEGLGKEENKKQQEQGEEENADKKGKAEGDCSSADGGENRQEGEDGEQDREREQDPAADRTGTGVRNPEDAANGAGAPKGEGDACANAGPSGGGDQQAGEAVDGEVDAAVDTSCDPMMREVWRQRILETAQNYEMMHGVLPGDIADVVRQFRESKIDYMQRLRRYLTLHSGGEAQWLPPARRFVWQKMYLPSRNDAALEAVLAIDTSGSTGPHLQKFFGDTLQIMRQFGKFHLTVIQCDAKIHDVTVLTEDSRMPKEIKVKGGGGTDFRPVFKYVQEHKLQPRVLIYFTDGYGGAPEKKPRYPVVWVLTPDGEQPCGWGDVIQLPKEG